MQLCAKSLYVFMLVHLDPPSYWNGASSTSCIHFPATSLLPSPFQLCPIVCAHIFTQLWYETWLQLGLLFYTFAKVSARIGWLVYENVKLRKYSSFSSCFVFASKPTVSPLDSDTFKFRSLVLCFIYDMNFFAHFALFWFHSGKILGLSFGRIHINMLACVHQNAKNGKAKKWKKENRTNANVNNGNYELFLDIGK